jgi:hypothetical protein
VLRFCEAGSFNCKRPYSKLNRDFCCTACASYRRTRNQHYLYWQWNIFFITRCSRKIICTDFQLKVCLGAVWHVLLTTCYSRDQLRWNKMGGPCNTHVERCAHRVVLGKPEWNRPLGRPRNKLKYNIKMAFQEVGWGVDWIDLAQDMDR